MRVAALTLLIAASSQAAYHYIHYPSRNSSTPIYEKFNLAALPNNTVTFFVADQAPNLYPNNEFGSILSQIRQAAAAWNSVAISDLRVAFGGLQSYTDNPTTSQRGSSIPNSTTPGGDILFVDTPGVLGLSAPTISTTPVQGAAGQLFFPIVRSVVMISRDTGAEPWPSSAETFFTTAVHEMGHALGLQHAWTGSAMSQGVIRMTSRARPLDADDIAAFATLYGKSGWQSSYGTISGRITLAGSGAGVTMASVVAISPTGPAVSTLTHPDGSYRIDGIPANNNYLVYAHPLPPDAAPADDSGLRRPVDFSNVPFSPSGPFQTVFYSGGGTTLDPQRATSFPIGAGSTVGDINFTVQSRGGVPTYNVLTFSRITAATREYGYPGDATVIGYPAFLSTSSTKFGTVIVQAQSPALLPVPEAVSILGGFTPATLTNGKIATYSDRPGDYIALYFAVQPGAGSGPRHLVFTFGNDIYVLPNGVDLVRKGPPVADGATTNGDGSVTISGAGFGPDSRVFFDGAQASPAVFSGADQQGSLTVVPPPGAPGQVAQITVYNSDGQNSTIIPTAPIPAYAYPSAAAPQIAAVEPSAVHAGTSAMVDLTVSNMILADGQVTVGFGSRDVQVRRVWVVGPNRLTVNVSVTSNAVVGFSEVSVVSGMQVAVAANAFQIQPTTAGVPAIAAIVNSADPAQSSLLAGQFATIYGQNLAGAQVSVNDVPVQIVVPNANQINFIVPAGLSAGPATLRLIAAGGSALPVALQIDARPPVITGINTLNGAPGPGDTVQIMVSGLDASVVANPQRVRVTISGMEMGVQQITPASAGIYTIQITVNQSFGGSQVPVVVSVDGSASAPANLAIR